MNIVKIDRMKIHTSLKTANKNSTHDSTFYVIFLIFEKFYAENIDQLFFSQVIVTFLKIGLAETTL